MSLITAAQSSKLAVGLFTAGIVAFGGAGAASYAGVLPDGLQQTASEIIGAPAPDEAAPVGDPTVTDEAPLADAPSGGTTAEDTTSGDTTTDTPTDSAAVKGPDASGSAAYGLCNASQHGGLADHSTAYASLMNTSTGDPTAYCATVTKPGEKVGDAVAQSDAGSEAQDGADAEIDNTTTQEAAQGAVTADKAAHNAAKDTQNAANTSSGKSAKATTKPAKAGKNK